MDLEQKQAEMRERNTGSSALALPTTASPTVHLVAKNPQEMGQSQEGIRLWLTQKVQDERRELTDVQDAHDIAVKRKWGAAALLRQANRAAARVGYYEKLLLAVEGGFCIVPNFPVDFFAIRVKKAKPRENFQEITDAQSYQSAANNVPDEKPATLPAGVGRYVSPSQYVKSEIERVKDATGKELVTKRAWATEFRDVVFPLVAARPEVMDATGHAMGLNIFDAVGICPQTRRGDPLIIGKIFGVKSGWYSGSQKEVSFLIAWHLDLRVL